MAIDLKMWEVGEDGKRRRIPGSWKKLFKMDLYAFLLVAVIVFNFFMFNPVTDECKEAIAMCGNCELGSVFNGSQYFNISNDSDNVSAVYDFVNKPHVEGMN